MKTINDKLNTIYGVKAISTEIKDVDEANRIVKGYLSSFNTKDSDNDVIRKGAFKKSLKERGVNSKANRRIAHLRNHDWEQQIGKFLELGEDDNGLFFVSELGRSTKGTDALLDYQDGILREHSIGFNYVEGKIKKKEDEEHGNYFEIKEVMLWEGSGVTFGANEFTPTLEANKSLEDSEYLLNLNNDMNTLIKALKNGKGTDERLENIEFKLKQIQQKYNSLIELKSFDKDTFLGESSNEGEAQKALQLKAEQDEQLKKLLLKNLIN
jgi:HK97 family phage prohead protease